LDKLKQQFAYSSNTNETLLENNGVYPPGIKYEKLEQLPVNCEENLQSVKLDPDYRFDAKKDFDIFWQAFNELYINFELREINWDDVYEEGIQSIDNVNNEEELFEFLGELITPLGDGHVVLIKTPISRSLG